MGQIINSGVLKKPQTDGARSAIDIQAETEHRDVSTCCKHAAESPWPAESSVVDSLLVRVVVSTQQQQLPAADSEDARGNSSNR